MSSSMQWFIVLLSFVFFSVYVFVFFRQKGSEKHTFSVGGKTYTFDPSKIKEDIKKHSDDNEPVQIKTSVIPPKTLSYDYEKLNAYFELESEVLNNQEVKVLTLYVTGPLHNKSKEIRCHIWITDITDEAEHPLLFRNKYNVLNKQYTSKHSSEWIGIPVYNGFFHESFDIDRIIINNILFPVKGERVLKTRVAIEDKSPNGQFIPLEKKIVSECNFVFDYCHEEKGYIDKQNEAEEIKKIEVRVGVLIAGAYLDGLYSDEVLKEVDKHIYSFAWENGQFEQTKQEMLRRESAIVQSLNGPGLITYELIEKEIKNLNEIASTAKKIESLEFFVSLLMMNIDYEEDTAYILEKVLESIDLADDMIQSVLEKKVYGKVLLEILLPRVIGINNKMSKEEKREKLKNEYKKWNQRVTHSEKDVREKAIMLLELISAERSNLDN